MFLSRHQKSKPHFNLIFLLTGGGKINYHGSKKWLDELSDDENELKSHVRFVLCLDSLGKGDEINLHVSKPPKAGSAAHKFIADLQKMAKILSPETKVEMVHKKINLVREREQTSIQKGI